MNRKTSLKTNKPLSRKTPLRPKSKNKFEISEIRVPSRKASRQTLMKKCDSAFSLFIRTRDSQQYEGGAFRCISCGRILPIEQADAGHYINRAHMSLRFDEDNVHAQCRFCNRFREGEITGYRAGLINKIGEKKVLLLEAMKNTSHKIANVELELMTKFYKNKTKKFIYQINKRL